MSSVIKDLVTDTEENKIPDERIITVPYDQWAALLKTATTPTDPDAQIRLRDLRIGTERAKGIAEVGITAIHVREVLALQPAPINQTPPPVDVPAPPTDTTPPS